jgi:AcrR family transcriptional regulator
MKPTPQESRPRGRPALTDEARETAVQAAAQLLEEQGLAGMKARTIANRAGLSVGSIYKLFGDIDDLIRLLNIHTYRDFAAHHQTALKGAQDRGASIEDQLLALAGAYVEFVEANESRWLALLSFNRGQGAPTAAYGNVQQELYAMVESVMSQSPGLADPVLCARTTRALWAAVHGIVVITLPGGGREEVLEQIGLMVSAVLHSAASAQ